MRHLSVILLSLFLSGCVTQDQADVKIAKGCAAGINALLENQGKEILEIKSKNYSSEDAEGGLHRRVTFKAIEKDGWLELDKEYSCLFMQEWGLFKSYHRALIVQVKIDDKILGKQDGKIIGSWEDFTKIVGNVEGAMAQ